MKNERNKGITLIALIITIIVLLILAGVTINALTGSENSMEKATEAREKDKQGAELEAIKLAVVNSVANGLTGLVDTNSLKSDLVGLIQENPEEIIVGNGPWVVTSPSGVVYEINQNASVTKLEPLNISSNLTITENKVKSLTVTKYGSANGKQVSWSKEGNITFVTDATGNTTVENPTTDTVYIKAGAFTNGTTGKVTVSATGEENQECNITIAEREWSKIGESVAYQSKYEKDNNITIGWRLFYRDEDYTYIIADRISTEYEPEVDTNKNGMYRRSGTYTPSSFNEITNVSKKVNQLLANSNDTKELFNGTLNNNTYTLNDNMITMAWLCDTNAWKEFTKNNTVSSEDNSTIYAIAAPPLEMLVNSYNETVNEDKNGRPLITILNVTNYGYTSNAGVINYSYKNEIYTKQSQSSWFLASPGYRQPYEMCYMNYSSSYASDRRVYLNGGAGWSMAIRPLVAIPNANFDFATLTVK